MQRNNSKLNQETPDAMPSFFEKIAEFKRKRTLQPLFIVVCLFSILHCTGVWAMQPYTVQILTAYEIPMESDKATALLSFVHIFACFVFFFVIRFTGKRRLYLTTATGIFQHIIIIERCKRSIKTSQKPFVFTTLQKVEWIHAINCAMNTHVKELQTDGQMRFSSISSIFLALRLLSFIKK